MLEYVEFSQMTEQDLEDLCRGTRADFGGVEPIHIAEQAQRKMAVLWRVRHEDGARGMLVTQVNQTTKGLEVLVIGVAGKGLIKHIEEIYEDLSKYAEAVGAKSIRGLVSRRGLQRLYKRLGFKEIAVEMVKELS